MMQKKLNGEESSEVVDDEEAAKKTAEQLKQKYSELPVLVKSISKKLEDIKKKNEASKSISKNLKTSNVEADVVAIANESSVLPAMLVLIPYVQHETHLTLIFEIIHTITITRTKEEMKKMWKDVIIGQLESYYKRIEQPMTLTKWRKMVIENDSEKSTPKNNQLLTSIPFMSSILPSSMVASNEQINKNLESINIAKAVPSINDIVDTKAIANSTNTYTDQAANQILDMFDWMSGVDTKKIMEERKQKEKEDIEAKLAKAKMFKAKVLKQLPKGAKISIMPPKIKPKAPEAKAKAKAKVQ